MTEGHVETMFLFMYSRSSITLGCCVNYHTFRQIFIIILNVSIMSPLQRLKCRVGRFSYFRRSE